MSILAIAITYKDKKLAANSQNCLISETTTLQKVEPFERIFCIILTFAMMVLFIKIKA